MGTLALLGAQARGRHLAAQAVEAHEKAVVAAEKLQHRKDLHAAAVEAAAVAKAQLDSAAEAGMDPSSLGGGGAAGAEAAGSQQPAAAANGGRASKRQRTNARGGGKGKGKDGEPAAALSLQEECVRLADRVKVMARCEQEAEEALESAKTGVEVAEAEAAQGAAEAVAATAEAAPEVAAAAAKITALNDAINRRREELGLGSQEVWLMDAELRRSIRVPRGGAMGGGGAAGSAAAGADGQVYGSGSEDEWDSDEEVPRRR